MADASGSGRSVRRAATTTVAPSAAKARAVAAPMPLEAPVPRATVESSRPFLVMAPHADETIGRRHRPEVTIGRTTPAGGDGRYRRRMAETSYRQHRFRRPPGATEILLVRHGESEPAVPGRPFPLVGGHGDPALAPEGRDQAEAVAERLADQQLDAIYVTTLRRTSETAAPLAARTGIEPRVEADLREVHLGEWEGGLFRQKVAAGDPIAAELLTVGRWDVIPGAESQEDLVVRVTEAVARIVEAHPDQRVAVFSHGGIIGLLVALATGGEPFAFTGCDNGSISHLVVTEDRWVLRRYNDTGHLPDGFDLAPTSEAPAGPGFSA